MKQFLLLTLIHFFISPIIVFSQKQIAPPPLRTPASLHPIPLIFTGNEPAVFLPGDSVTTPYIRTHIIEFNSNSNVDNNYLINGLKQQGKNEGVDGIILNDYRKLSPGPLGMIGSITGVGIKYTGMINYLDTILKQKVISLYEPDGSRGKTVIIDFDWYGNILNPYQGNDVSFFADSMSFIDLNLIYNRISNIYEYRAFENQTVHRIISLENWPFRITHQIESNPYEIIHLITSKNSRVYPTEKNMKVKIKPVHTGDLLTGAIVTSANAKETPLFYLHYKFDAKGRLTDERWEKLINGKRTLWLEVENRYFDNDIDLTASTAVQTKY
jgi:hypothetical protein